MNSRQRFLETMRFGSPDRVPLFEEGLRDEVLEAWQMQGVPPDVDLSEMFHYDLREEIDPELDSGLYLVKLSKERHGLEKLRRRLDPDDPHRLPGDWDKRVRAWKQRQHPLMLFIHQGFFLTLGIEDGRSFVDAIYLIGDQPEFVRQAMAIQGEFAARLAERVLKEVDVDAAIFSEPIAGNHGSLISPRMYEEYVLSSYQPILDVLTRNGVQTIIMRTYANARVLLPVIFKKGFNCLWACETNPRAMDYLELRREFGRDLRLIGGIDLDVLRYGKEAIRREMEEKVPPLLAEGGYIPLADGRVRDDMLFENYRYYRELLEELAHR
jgi:hypothetical protein